MSRVGKKIIPIPSGVKIENSNGKITVTGPKGSLQYDLHPMVELKIEGQEVTLHVAKENDKRQKALWGTNRAIIANMVLGVTTGFEKKLELNGVGYKVSIAGKTLQFALGFSHPVNVEVPSDLNVTVEKNVITVQGSDKQKVGQFAAQVRELKKPEPYKGKGIKYSDETILRKAGKVMKAVGK